MDRAQFMQQLEKLLFDISDAERQEALDYYESYFDDAGEEQEADVIRELGTPDKVAAIIKADLKESNDRYAEYTELGYEDTRTREPGQVPDKYTAITRTGDSAKTEKEEQNRDGSRQTYTNERRFGRDRARGRFEQAFGRAGEQMGQAFGRAGEQMGQAFSRAGEHVDQAFSRAGEHMDQAFNQAGEQFDQARSRAGEQFGQAFEQAGEQFDQARNRAEEHRNRARSRAQEHRDKARNRADRCDGEKKKNHTGMILLLILLVFASPFISGAVGGILGVVLTLLSLPFLLVFGFGAAAIGILAGAVRTIAGGIGLCFGSPAAGILTIGVGCLLMALSIVFGMVTIWIAGRILPWLFHKIMELCRRIFHRGRKDGEGI